MASAVHTSLLRVQPIPAGHPYTRSVAAPAITTLADPPVPGAPAGRWWPHPALEPGWAENTDADVVHLHFGFEHRTAFELASWVDDLRAAGIGLVLTVHDLVNPHLGPSADFDALLDVLVPAADAVTTLTEGASCEIARRWGRRAVVHPHPHVVAEGWLERPRPETGHWTVDVHAKSLRASFDIDAVLEAARVIRELPDAVLRLHAHDEVLDPHHPRHDPRLIGLLDEEHVDARVHPPLTDEDLWADLLEADLALLPYRFATHSGWLEMCHDLGTSVLAADVGYLGEQRPVRTYAGPAALADALTDARAAHRRGERAPRPSSADRRRESDEVRELHARLYGEVAGGRR